MHVFSEETYNKLYYVTKTTDKDGKTWYAPASYLDCVLAPKDLDLKVEYRSNLNGKVINQKFPQKIADKASKRVYSTTDHTIIVASYTTNGRVINYIHVSTDNSVRANSNNSPLFSRFPDLVGCIKKVIDSLEPNSEVVLFLNEVHRPSFDGKTIEESLVVIKWLTLAEILASSLGLTYVGTYSNNPSQMSFGIAVFTSGFQDCKVIIEQLLPAELNGCVCVGIEIDGALAWVTHFPIDFVGKNEESKTYKVMSKLLSLFNEYPNSKFALGDFNTIYGNMADAALLALSEHPDKELRISKYPTFYASYFDLIPELPSEPRVYFLENDSF